MTYTVHFDDGSEKSGYVNDFEEIPYIGQDNVLFIITTSDDGNDICQWTPLDDWESIVEDGICCIF